MKSLVQLYLFEIRYSLLDIRYSLFLFSFFVSHSSFAQEDTAIVRTYGGPYYEEGRQIIECAAGGYAIIGTTGSDQQNNTNFYLLRLDEELNCMWSKSLGGPEVEWGYSLLEDAEGNFLLCGYTNSYGAGAYDVLVYKVNAEGEVIWQQTFGGTDWDFAYKIIAHPEEGYLICGKTYSMGNGGSDGYLMHVDDDGELIFEWTYGGEGDDEFVDVEFGDSSNLIVLSNWEDDNQKRFIRVLNLNQSGLIDWQFDKILVDYQTTGNSLSIDDGKISVCGYRFNEEILNAFYFVLNSVVEEIDYFSENFTFEFVYSDIDFVGDTVVLTGATAGAGAGGFDAVDYFFENGSFLGAPTYGESGEDEMFQSIIRSNGNLLSVGKYASIENGYSQVLVTKHTRVVSGDYIQEFDFTSSCFVLSNSSDDSPRPNEKIVGINYYDLLGRRIELRGSQNITEFFIGVVIKETVFENQSVRIEKLIIR